LWDNANSFDLISKKIFKNSKEEKLALQFYALAHMREELNFQKLTQKKDSS